MQKSRNLLSPELYVFLVEAATERLQWFWISALRSPRELRAQDMGLGRHGGPGYKSSPFENERGNPGCHSSCLQCALPFGKSYALRLGGSGVGLSP